MEGVNSENNPTVQIDSTDLEKDICTTYNRISSGAKKRKRAGNERIINADALYSLMRFPRGFATETVSPVISSRHASILTCDIEFPSHVGLIHTDLLESLVNLTSDIAVKSENMVLAKQMKAALYTNILRRIAYSAAQARFLDCSSFRLLDKIFKEFVIFLMNTKDEVKTIEEQESHRGKFNARAIKIDNIIGIDISTLGSMLSNEIYSKWQDFFSEEEPTEKRKVEVGDEALEDLWNFLQESVLKDIVHIHNSIFGSEDLVRSPRSIKISDADRLSLFMDSYSLGVNMVKCLEGTLPSSLDTKLSPEHLLHLSLDCKKNIIVSQKSSPAYNFYKDSNAPFMAKMMELLVTLKEHILIPMNESNDPSVYQKILDVINLILGMPLSTPLAKALIALQFLLDRVKIIPERVSKSSLSDQLEPIIALVLSWKKLEFESCSALLDEIQSQYEINAGKLWLPLYSLLNCTEPADHEMHNDITIQGLNEYITTSNIGEFRKRLQLLFAMHGQIKTGITQRFYLSPCHVETEKIVYNIFGLHMQFLPLILRYITDERKKIVLELKDFIEACRGEQSDAYLPDNPKKIRQEFMKIIQRYNDVLQQPLMIILKQEADREMVSNRHTFSPLAFSLIDARNQPHFCDEYRSAWIDSWKTETDAAVKILPVVRATEFVFPSFSEVTRIMESVSSPSFGSGYQEETRKVWCTIRNVYKRVCECSMNWREGQLSVRMSADFSKLLELLHSCGLCESTSVFIKIFQPSYNRQHLLLTDGMTSENTNEKIQTSLFHSLENEWKYANQNFFRSISSYRQLKNIRQNAHKDFTCKQVSQSLLNISSLVAIQQEQCAAAYDFAARLEFLEKSILPLKNIFSSSNPFASASSSFPENQHATYKCMWQQKQLFDGSCALLHDISLLVRTVESSDLDTCQKVLTKLLPFVEESVLHFQKSKDSLDNYLLGKDRIITSVEVILQPNGVLKQMEQLVVENFSVIREFKKRVSSFRQQDIDRGSVAEILFDHLEAIFAREKVISEEYETTFQARNDSDHEDEDSHLFVSGFVQALEQTYKDVGDSFSKFGSSNSVYFKENSLENIWTWKAVFESNVSSLKLDEICDGLVKTIQFTGNSENPGHAAHLKYLYSLLEQTLAYGRGLLRDFLLMRIAVSQITDAMAKMFDSLYSEGYPICAEKLYTCCSPVDDSDYDSDSDDDDSDDDDDDEH